MYGIIYRRNIPQKHKTFLVMKHLLHRIWVACFCFLMLFILPVVPHAQNVPLVNNFGTSWYFYPGSYMIVNNDSLRNHSGSIENGGTIRIDGTITNDDTLAGGDSGTGLYDIGGDWVNNGIVISRQDTVLLSGDINGSAGPSGNQLITGTSPTPFHTLILGGTFGSVKTQTIDASVSGILDLRSSELATNQYAMTVLNPDPNAIQKQPGDIGYVSSLGSGQLIRATAQTADYLFPVGTPSSLVSGGAQFYYRPITMVPVSVAANQYGVRLVNDPTGDGYDVALRDDSLELVNPGFYHRLYHNVGTTPATITMHYDASVDGDWSHIGQHRNVWSYTKPAQPGNALGFSTLSISNWSDFTPYPFALATLVESANPVNGTIYVPNAFSPNGDGTNDVFMPYASNPSGLRMAEFTIFNRWGEKIFESSQLGAGWDGTYKGVIQNPGVYVWQLTYGYLGDTRASTRKGSVTLIR